MAIQSSKLEKDEEKDRLAIFKPGLWRTGFYGMVPFPAATNGE